MTEELTKRQRDTLARMIPAFDKIDRLLLRLSLQGLQRMSTASAVELQALQQTAHNAALIHIERQLDVLATVIERYLNKDPLFMMNQYSGAINRIWLLNARARVEHAAGKSPAQMVEIIGEARRSYRELEEPLILQPLGASGWVSDTDFVGVTLYLASLANPGRIYQASNCKPTMYFGNNPRRLLRENISEHVPFRIHDLAHGAFQFTKAKCSRDGRLSLHRELQVAKAPYQGGQAYDPFRADTWLELVDRLREGSVHPVRGAEDQLFYVEPDRHGELVIDDKRAEARATLYDAAGSELNVVVPLRQENNFLIDNLEILFGSSLFPDGLFGRAWVAEGEARFFPYTALYHQSLRLMRGAHVSETHLSLESLKGAVR